MRRGSPRPGDRFTVHCTTTTGADDTHVITAEQVDELGCGCWRIRTRRPGPQTVPTQRMEVFTGCGSHTADVIPEQAGEQR